MKKFRRLLILLLLALGLFGWVPGAKAQTGAVVKVDPASIDVDPEQNFSLNVIIENVEDLFAFDVVIDYDPDLLIYMSIELGDFLEEGDLSPTTILYPGRVQYIFTQTGNVSQKSGTGNLLTINFRAKDVNDSANINIISAELTNKNGDALIACELLNGIVQIGQGKTEFMNYLPLVIH